METADLQHMEAKLRDAWIKMRKLDKKLARVLRRERQVKRETLRLIEKNRADLERLKYTTDHKESKLEADNTAHFLALSYIPDLDDDELDEREMLQQPMTPLFKTQPPDDESASSTGRSGSSSSEPHVEAKRTTEDRTQTEKSSDAGSHSFKAKKYIYIYIF